MSRWTWTPSCLPSFLSHLSDPDNSSTPNSTREGSGDASGFFLCFHRQQLVHWTTSEIKGCSTGLCFHCLMLHSLWSLLCACSLWDKSTSCIFLGNLKISSCKLMPQIHLIWLLGHHRSRFWHRSDTAGRSMIEFVDGTFHPRRLQLNFYKQQVTRLCGPCEMPPSKQWPMGADWTSKCKRIKLLLSVWVHVKSMQGQSV